MPKKVKSEVNAEEQASKEHREQLAREANEKRNAALLAARNNIADSADRLKDEEDDLKPLTDEEWAQGDRPEDRRKTRAELEAEQEEEEDSEEEEQDEEEDSAAKVISDKEQEDRDLDEVRDAGADDSRKTDQGVTEYRLVVNGKVKWLTLEALRATAGKVESADEYLRGAKDGATTAPTRDDTPEAQEAKRQAVERQKAEAEAYKTRLKDLYTKASMGDEQAIDELAEIQAGLSRVTPDVLRIVDERVDARVMGRSAFEKAVEWFEGEYADELSTKTLKSYAARRDRELATENPDMEPKARLKTVGDEMRQLRRDLGGKPREVLENKQQRKAGAPQVPRAEGRRRPESEPDETESTQDAIARMAKSRGQMRAVKH